jgi:hypothetical protein
MLKPNTPPAATALLDQDFIAMRARLLEIAAYLDRLDRAGGTDDFRLAAFLRAVQELSSASPDRTRRILELWSDQSRDPIEKATSKGAIGVAPPLLGSGARR